MIQPEGTNGSGSKAFAGREDSPQQLSAEAQPDSERPLTRDCTFTAINSHIKSDVEDCGRADPWRFSVGVVFFYLSITNAMQWIAFASIVDEVREFFNMTAMEVNMLATVYVIAYITIVFLSCKLYEVSGIKLGLVIAALTNAIGSWIKVVALYTWPSPALLYTAQVFNSFTQVLIIATPPLIANRWFPKNERGVANTVLSSGLNFGSGIGALVPTLFVTPERKSKKHFAIYFWFNLCLCTLGLVLMIFCVPKKPRHVANFAARILEKKQDAMRYRYRKAQKEEQKVRDSSVPYLDIRDKNEMATGQARPWAGSDRPRESDDMVLAKAPPIVDLDEELDSLLEEQVEVSPVNVFSVLVDCYRACRKSPSLLLLIFMSAAELGLVWSMETVLPQLFKPYGISEGATGWIGFLNLMLGTVLCPFLMPLVERFGYHYKEILSGTAVILTGALLTMTLLLYFGPHTGVNATYYITVLVICWGVISGMCQNFTMPLMFEYVVELTFPMPESTSAPMLMWSACTMNLVLALVFGAVLTENPDRKKSLIVFIIAIVITVTGTLAIIITKSEHKRRDYEARKAEERERQLNRIELEESRE